MGGIMHIMLVYIQVKEDQIDAFKRATIENASNSLKEPGVVRFEVLQQKDDPARFLLCETYKTPDDPARHKETAHYKKWALVAEPMMAQPRTRTIYSNVFPE
jgi:(4S)-4-hydroxy-5-phosphonooxypentane-2,3-dione isomerase